MLGELGFEIDSCNSCYQAHFLIAYGPASRPPDIEAHEIQALAVMNLFTATFFSWKWRGAAERLHEIYRD